MLATPFNRATVQPHQALGSGWRSFDYVILATVLILMGFGVVSIWSAVEMPSILSDNLSTRQALLGAIGLGLMLVVSSINYRVLASFAWVFYWASILSLVAVISPLGIALGGSQRWFLVGDLLIQPSEFAKVSTALALAVYISSRGEAMRELGSFLTAGAIVALPTVLVLIQPDLGQAMIYLALWASSLLIMQTRRLYILILAVSLPLLAVFAWEFVMVDYQQMRFLTSYNPELDPLGGGYQVIQARVSIGAGGLLGDGLAGGTQSRMDLLGVRDSDFIFAHAAGMFGFVGMIALFATMVLFLWRCLRVVEVSRDQLGRNLAIAITGTLFFQTVLNVGMNVNLMPVTGVTLPFVSYGVSSLWTCLIMVGVLQSICMHRERLTFKS